MTERDKMMAFHAMQEIKEMPECFQDLNLVLLCKIDPTGKIETVSRILAEHKMPSTEIIPCLMDLFQEVLIDKEEKHE